MTTATASEPLSHWSYEVFGLTARSALELPGLRATVPEDGADIEVWRGSVSEPDGYPITGIAARSSPEADVLAWYRRGRIRVTEAAIEVDGDDERFLRQCVVGPGLGVLMHRRGRLVLHGSAVDVGGRAVVLLGQKGAGKSTTAGALLRQGHRLLTDDLVVLREDDGDWWVEPGPTQMKLWPASAKALDLESDVEPFVEGLDKGVWHGAPTAGQPVRLGAVCALTWGPDLRAEATAGTEAFGDAFTHAYAPRFLGAGAGPPLVGLTARLVEGVETYRLVRPQELGGLSAVVARVEGLVS